MDREMRFQLGGREYTAADFQVLQEQIKLLEAIFSGRGAFVLSGCEVGEAGSGQIDIGEGQVYIDGLVISFSETLEVNLNGSNEVYMVATPPVDSDPHGSGWNTRIEYGAELVEIEPGVGEYITFTAEGALTRMRITELEARPEHEWNGTLLRFQNPDGSWGTI